ncbi:MAG: DUF2905 domain-containing protein [Deltaproteobacteria bacterium]
MNPWGSMARFLITGGAILLALGLIFWALAKLGPNWQLPGDIMVRRGSFTFFFPLMTCILLSIILTILLNLFVRR